MRLMVAYNVLGVHVTADLCYMEMTRHKCSRTVLVHPEVLGSSYSILRLCHVRQRFTGLFARTPVTG